VKAMNFKKLIAATAMALASISAQATLIDFESTGTPGNVNGLNYAIDGFVFNSTMDNIDIGSGSPWGGTGPAHSGSFAGLNNYGGAGEITKAGGGTFSFENLWLRSWYNSTSSGTISGWLNGAQVGSVSGVRNTSWTQFTGNFASIDTLRIDFGNYFLLDDISLNSANISPVPEPETYAMLLAGLGLMGGIARRRKQKLANA
jgi:hypothetical protein